MVIHHESIIDNGSFNSIRSGTKRVKFYLNDAKRSGLKSGDFIKYIDDKSGESITVLAKDIIYAKSSDELATKLNQTESLASYLTKWFSIDDQEKHGLIAVQIEIQKERE